MPLSSRHFFVVSASLVLVVASQAGAEGLLGYRSAPSNAGSEGNLGYGAAACDTKPGCGTPNGCDQRPGCNPPCGCDKGRPGPTNPRPGPDEEEDLLAVPRGIFAAPPRTGAAVAASQASGLRGGAITLPEITLRLPSIEFPSCMHFSRSPEMYIEGSRAPYVANPNYYTMLAAQAAQKRSADEDDKGRDGPEDRGADCTSKAARAEQGVDDCKKQLKELQDCMRMQMEHMKKCMDLMESKQTQSGGNNAPPHGAGQPQVAPLLPPRAVPTTTTDAGRGVPAIVQPLPAAYDPYPVRASQYVEEFRPVGPVRPVHQAAQRPYLERLPSVE